MTRKIVRTYTFTEEDIRNALCAWLRKLDLQAPQYIGNTPCTTWTVGLDGSQTVEWSVEDEPAF